MPGMPRPLRLQYENAVYHVTARGNEGNPIAYDDGDRAKWLSMLQNTGEKYGWRVFAFALLGNHYHLLLRTPKANLSEGIQHFNGRYACHFNKRHRRRGHLFQGRFHAVVVRKEAHWLELTRYIHLNPVRAGVVKEPASWSWSSCAGYCSWQSRRSWIDYDTVLSEFGRDAAKACRKYREFLTDGMGRSSRHSAQESGETCAHAPLQPLPAPVTVTPSLQEIADSVARHFETDPSRWAVGKRCDSVARAVVAHVARTLTSASLRDIADMLGYRNDSSVTVACKRIAKAMQDPRFRAKVDSLLQKFQPSYGATNQGV
jgi:REP element-mobilizing transposase RayT